MESKTFERPPSSRHPKGMRLPSSRLPNGYEVVVPTAISATNIPMSSNGLPSANTSVGQRRVVDSRYYIGILRQRMNDIKEELGRLHEGIEMRKRSQALTAGLKENIENLRQEIAVSEAELADYNVLSDRLNSKVSIHEMQHTLEETKQSNERLEKEANNLFRENKDIASIVNEQETHLQEMLNGKLPPQQQQMLQEIESIDAQCKELKCDGNLVGKSREELMEIFKETTQKIGTIEKEIQDETKCAQTAQNKLKKLEDGLKTQIGQKFVELRKREAAMNDFMRKYPEMKAELQNKIVMHQKQINLILSRTSSDIESLKSLPTAEAYSKLHDEFKYKQKQMNEAQATLMKLQLELEQRRCELADLQSVDQKIQQKQIEIQNDIEMMKKEMPRYSDIETIREEKEKEISDLTAERDKLKEFVRNLKKITNTNATKYNNTKAELQANELHNRIRNCEREIRKRAQENASINDCIEEIHRTTSYNIAKKQIFSIVTEMNDNINEAM